MQDLSFIMAHTDEPMFYDEELGLYVLGVRHFGTAWSLAPAPDNRSSCAPYGCGEKSPHPSFFARCIWRGG